MLKANDSQHPEQQVNSNSNFSLKTSQPFNHHFWMVHVPWPSTATDLKWRPGPVHYWHALVVLQEPHRGLQVWWWAWCWPGLWSRPREILYELGTAPEAISRIHLLLPYLQDEEAPLDKEGTHYWCKSYQIPCQAKVPGAGSLLQQAPTFDERNLDFK